MGRFVWSMGLFPIVQSQTSVDGRWYAASRNKASWKSFDVEVSWTCLPFIVSCDSSAASFLNREWGWADLCGVWGCFRLCRRRSTGADIRPRTRFHGNLSTLKYDELVFIILFRAFSLSSDPLERAIKSPSHEEQPKETRHFASTGLLQGSNAGVQHWAIRLDERRGKDVAQDLESARSLNLKKKRLEKLGCCCSAKWKLGWGICSTRLYFLNVVPYKEDTTPGLFRTRLVLPWPKKIETGARTCHRRVIYQACTHLCLACVPVSIFLARVVGCYALPCILIKLWRSTCKPYVRTYGWMRRKGGIATWVLTCQNQNGVVVDRGNQVNNLRPPRLQQGVGESR